MTYKAEPYRWVALFCVVPILAVTQLFWLTFSAISDTAAHFYNVSPLSIAFLSMSYMIVYIIMTVPASMLADKKGLRAAFITGAVITAVCGLTRGLCAGSFTLVVIAQIGMAVAQPFLMNPITKLAATWFPVNERATATGIASIAGYLGIVIAMVFTPQLVADYTMNGMLMVYAYISIASAVLVIVLLRERPKTPAGPGGEVSSGFAVRDLGKLFRNRNFLLLTIIMFIALGTFNALLTVIGDMLLPRGITADQAGLIGGVIILFGLGGAAVIPILSDKKNKRRIFLIVSLLISLVGIAGLCYTSDFTLLLISGAIAGFFLMGTGPLAFQFGTEIAYPSPEGASYGMLMTAGQIAGILFILLLYGLQTKAGSMVVPLSILFGAMIVGLFVSARLKESTVIKSGS
ncbi:MAG: MFS transporter [Eubacteriales bacterium]